MRDLINKRLSYWEKENLNFFGIHARNWDEYTYEEKMKFLAEDAKENWTTDSPCELLRLIMDGTVCKNFDHCLPGTIEIEMNKMSECIDVFGTFDLNGDGRKINRRLIVSMPTPHTDLFWVIGKSKRTPRIVALRDSSFINKSEDGKSVGNDKWDYDLTTLKFSARGKTKKKFDPFETLTPMNKAFLTALLREEVTKENFEKALQSVPYTDYRSVFQCTFGHLNAFFDFIRLDKRRYANPIKNIPLPINSIFMNKSEDSLYDINSLLVISETPIYSLENFNTVVYKGRNNQIIRKKKNNEKADYVPPFSFVDSLSFFDAFKTTTSKSAGRQRLLLDNIEVGNDGMLWLTAKDGKKYNMYEVMFNRHLQTNNLSCITRSLFCDNDAGKRIMMTGKLRAQAVPVVAQEDPFINSLKARVVFGDYEGYSLADSILISKTFAKKLRNAHTTTVSLEHDSLEEIAYFKEKIERQDFSINYEELCMLFPFKNKMILKDTENCIIKRYEFLSETILKLHIYIEVPFKNGDKLTNFHGSKGVCGLIIPDEEMPRLKNDIGDFKAGIFDVIISGMSVARRNTFGQIFEAWAQASGIEFEFGEDLISKAVTKYGDQMKDFASKSIIEFKGTETIKPCGIIDMIRVHHHATTKISHSELKNNFNRMLKFEEMLKLNLAANECPYTLKEMSIRSTKKHSNAFYQIYKMMNTGELDIHAFPNLMFAKLLKSMNIDFLIDGRNLAETDYTNITERSFNEIYNYIVNDDSISLTKLFEEDVETNEN